jgi:DNA-directed RNA polymerase III subunit RPC11
MLTVARIPADGSNDDSRVGQNRFECRSCPYQFLFDQPYFERSKMTRKELEDILGGEAAWENVDQTEILCDREGCNNTKAFFRQVQIRSADEPMSTFYRVSLTIASQARFLLTVDSVLYANTIGSSSRRSWMRMRTEYILRVAGGCVAHGFPYCMGGVHGHI